MRQAKRQHQRADLTAWKPEYIAVDFHCLDSCDYDAIMPVDYLILAATKGLRVSAPILLAIEVAHDTNNIIEQIIINN